MFCHVNAKFFLMSGLIFGTCQKEDETMPRLPDSLATSEDIDSIEMETYTDRKTEKRTSVYIYLGSGFQY